MHVFVLLLTAYYIVSKIVTNYVESLFCLASLLLTFLMNTCMMQLTAMAPSSLPTHEASYIKAASMPEPSRMRR